MGTAGYTGLPKSKAAARAITAQASSPRGSAFKSSIARRSVGGAPSRRCRPQARAVIIEVNNIRSDRALDPFIHSGKGPTAPSPAVIQATPYAQADATHRHPQRVGHHIGNRGVAVWLITLSEFDHDCSGQAQGNGPKQPQRRERQPHAERQCREPQQMVQLVLLVEYLGHRFRFKPSEEDYRQYGEKGDDSKRLHGGTVCGGKRVILMPRRHLCIRQPCQARYGRGMMNAALDDEQATDKFDQPNVPP